MRLSNITTITRWTDRRRRWLANGLVFLLMAPCLAFSLSRDILPSPGGLCMIYAASAVLIGLLLAPLPAPPLALAGWSALAVLAAGAPLALQASVARALPPALAAGVLVFLFSALTTGCAARRRNAAIVRLTPPALALLAAGAPVWLGPAAERWADSPAVVNAVVAISPLSYLAAAAQEDYLRGDWFYRNTPLGGLRYDYPSAAWQTGVYLAIALLSLTVQRRWRPRRGVGFTAASFSHRLVEERITNETWSYPEYGAGFGVVDGVHPGGGADQSARGGAG